MSSQYQLPKDQDPLVTKYLIYLTNSFVLIRENRLNIEDDYSDQEPDLAEDTSIKGLSSASLNLEIDKAYKMQQQNNRYIQGQNQRNNRLDQDQFNAQKQSPQVKFNFLKFDQKVQSHGDLRQAGKHDINTVLEQNAYDEEDFSQLNEQQKHKQLSRYESQKILQSQLNQIDQSSQYYMVNNRGSLKNLQQIKAYSGGNMNHIAQVRKRIMSAKRPNHMKTMQIKNLDKFNNEDPAPYATLQQKNSMHQNGYNLRNAIQSAKSNQKIIFEKNALVGGQIQRQKSQKRVLQYFEKEQLQEECLTLKEQVNDVKEYNIVLKNQKQFLQNEITKRDKIIDSMNQALYQSQIQLKSQQNVAAGQNQNSSLNSQTILSPKQVMFSPILVMNLKRTIQDLQNQMQAKDEELDFTRKKIKFTKINELEVELEILKEHAVRQRQQINFQQIKINELKSLNKKSLIKQSPDSKSTQHLLQVQSQQSERSIEKKRLSRIHSAKERFHSSSNLSIYKNSQQKNLEGSTPRFNVDFNHQLKKQEDQIVRLKAQLEVQKRLVSDKKLENELIRRNQTEQMDNTRKLIETLSVNNLKKSLDQIQELKQVNDKNEDQAKVNTEEMVNKIDDKYKLRNLPYYILIAIKFKVFNKLLIEQLSKENEFLRKNEESNLKEREKMRDIEKNLHKQFGDLKVQLDSYQNQQSKANEESKYEMKDKMIENQKKQIISYSFYQNI